MPAQTFPRTSSECDQWLKPFRERLDYCLASNLAPDGRLPEWRRVRAEFLQGPDSVYEACRSHIRSLRGDPSLPAYGAAVNRMKGIFESEIEDCRRKIEASVGQPRSDSDAVAFDPTMPGVRARPGALHPLTLVQEEVARVFGTLGFEVVTGPEVEDEAHNFDGLNIPPGHPARDPSENLLLPGGWLLRSQTSPVQVRTLEETVRRHGPRPVRVIAPGRVFRPDTVDARHLYAFHQVEGLCVGEGVSFADLKGTLAAFAAAFYGDAVGTRFRPSYFPFTEPSAEMDVSCPLCSVAPAGVPPPDPAAGEAGRARCAVCGGERWMELLGCGMVHPEVLRRAGYDPERWTGFAFGMGIERAAMRRWDIHDIRWLVENDVRFLGQFA